MRGVLFLACLSSAYAGFLEECYQCAYNPADVTVDQIRVSRIVYEDVRVPRTVYHEGKVPRVVHHGIPGKQSYHYGYQPVKRFVYGNQQFLKIVHDTKQVSRVVYDTQNVTHSVPGGWEPCGHGFTHDEATMYGITITACGAPCYLRMEGNNLYRGCYQDEFGVDPGLVGCHEQAGAIWCFCEGDLCNNHRLADS